MQDEKYFHGMKWQYMILDEAQAIKSSSSARWNTLLSFHCRNRLLLTGTPIQNSMQGTFSLKFMRLHADSSRTLGTSPFHHASIIRFPRRVQRMVLERYRECCRWPGEQLEFRTASTIAYDLETVHASASEETRSEGIGR